jgi:hypothetical protein
MRIDYTVICSEKKTTQVHRDFAERRRGGHEKRNRGERRAVCERER